MAMPKGGSRTQLPTIIKFQKGSLNTSRANEKEPTHHPGIPDAPPYLSESEKEAWERFADTLHTSMKVLTKEDYAAFESLTCTYDEVRRIRQALRDDPSVTCVEPKINKQGEVVGEVVKLRPEWSALNQADTRLGQWLGRFGLTPGDRARVQMFDGDEKTDPKKKADSEFGT